MKNSYLIQRLQKPFKIKNLSTPLEKLARDNPFAFGGGLRNGGLTDKAMALLWDIFQFDYMGSAEFEFGAVPETVQTIAKNIEHYEAFELPKVKYKYKNWKTREDFKGVGTVYVICRKDCNVEVTKRIRAKALGDYGKHKNNFSTKEAVLLNEGLGKAYSFTGRNACGWLELDNGYFFFTDKEMFEEVSKLFGIKSKLEAIK